MNPGRHRYHAIYYVIIGALEGVLAGWWLLGLLMALDVQGIGTLIQTVDAGHTMFLLAVVMFAVTFGMAGIAWQVMVLLPHEPGEDE